MSKAKKTEKTRKKAAEKPSSGFAELTQLQELRNRFEPLPDTAAEALLAQHPENDCRDRGTTTRSSDTFRGAMQWARFFAEHPRDPIVNANAQRIRWFFDTLWALGLLLDQRAKYIENPSTMTAIHEAETNAAKMLKRALRRARSAAGSIAAHNAAIDATTPEEEVDALRSHLQKLSKLLHQWSTDKSNAPPVALFGIDESFLQALDASIKTLVETQAKRPAPREFDRDDTAINIVEGRLHFAMRALWDDFSEGREDGLTSLLLPVTPALRRGMGLERQKKAAPKETHKD